MVTARGSDIIPTEYFHIEMFALGRRKLAAKALWGAGFLQKSALGRQTVYCLSAHENKQ